MLGLTEEESGRPMATRGSKPILERVRVLETGDGRISKFSGDGAAIQELMKSRYMPKDGVAGARICAQGSRVNTRAGARSYHQNRFFHWSKGHVSLCHLSFGCIRTLGELCGA